MRHITALILATTALTFELSALVATQNVPMVKNPMKAPEFTKMDASHSKMALPREVLKGQVDISKTEKLLSITAKTDFTYVDFMLAGKGRNIVTEKDAHIKIEQPKRGTFLANFGNFNDSKLALHKGTITAKQGHLVMANPAGFMFEDGSKVDVARLTVLVGGKVEVDSGNNIHMHTISHPDAVFINQGDISLSDAGLSSFVAPHMAHFGKIIASKGNVQLRAGVVGVDLYGDGNILIETQETDLKEAEMLAQEHLGDQGLYLLSGKQGLDIIKSAVNTPNTTTHAHIQGSDIIIGGPVVALKKTVVVASTPQKEGGRVKLEGKFITVDKTSTINASGANTGGRILIGGDFQGNLEKHAFKGNPGNLTPHGDFTINSKNNAHSVVIEDGAKLTATGDKQGGQAIIWSGQNSNDGSTTYMDGLLTLTSQNGTGGDFEISSKGQLTVPFKQLSTVTDTTSSTPPYTLEISEKLLINKNHASDINHGIRLWDPAHLVFATTGTAITIPWDSSSFTAGTDGVNVARVGATNDFSVGQNSVVDTQVSWMNPSSITAGDTYAVDGWIVVASPIASVGSPLAGNLTLQATQGIRVNAGMTVTGDLTLTTESSGGIYIDSAVSAGNMTLNGNTDGWVYTSAASSLTTTGLLSVTSTGWSGSPNEWGIEFAGNISAGSMIINASNQAGILSDQGSSITVTGDLTANSIGYQIRFDGGVSASGNMNLNTDAQIYINNSLSAGSIMLATPSGNIIGSNKLTTSSLTMQYNSAHILVQTDINTAIGLLSNHAQNAGAVSLGFISADVLTLTSAIDFKGTTGTPFTNNQNISLGGTRISGLNGTNTLTNLAALTLATPTGTAMSLYNTGQAAASGVFNFSDATSAAGTSIPLTFQSGGNLTIAAALPNVSNPLTFISTGAGNIAVANSITSSSSITLNSAGAITGTGKLTTPSLTLQYTGAKSLAQNDLTSALTLLSNASTLTSLGFSTSTGDLTVGSDVDWTKLSGVPTNLNFSLISAGVLGLPSTLTGRGNGNLTLSSSGDIGSSGIPLNITIKGSLSILNATSAYINSAADLSLGSILHASGYLVLASSGAIHLTGTGGAGSAVGIGTTGISLSATNITLNAPTVNLTGIGCSGDVGKNGYGEGSGGSGGAGISFTASNSFTINATTANLTGTGGLGGNGGVV